MNKPTLLQGYLLAGASVLLTSFAQLSMKWGMSHLSHPLSEIISQPFWTESKTALIFVSSGILAYMVSMLCWLQTLAQLPLNKAYPMLSISYALVYIATISLPWFQQAFSLSQCIGVILITCGVILTLSSSSHKEH